MGTNASTNENRRVHFCDGFDTLEIDVGDSIDDTNAPVVEWIYIDRDICGFSLYEYAPNDVDFADFASFIYGGQFLEEFRRLESLSDCERCLDTETSYEEYSQEERQLNKALMLAGVKAHLL